MSTKDIEQFMNEYVKSTNWDPKKLDLGKFQEILGRAFLILALLRGESKDIKDNKKKEDSNEKNNKPFRIFDQEVFNNQLVDFVYEAQMCNGNYNSLSLTSLKDCAFKTLYDNIGELNGIPDVVGILSGVIDTATKDTIDKIVKLLDAVKTSMQDVLKSSNKYMKSTHFRILKRVRLRKRFFELFIKQLESFNSWVKLLKDERVSRDTKKNW